MKGFEFYCVNEQVFFDTKISAMSELKIPWARESNDFYKKVGKNTSLCEGMRDLCSTGWVVTAWTDLFLKRNAQGNLSVLDVPSPSMLKHLNHDPVTFFESDQFSDFVKVHKSIDDTVVKINTPWRVKCPRGWGLLQVPMFYHNETRFYACPGVVDPRKNTNQINVPVFMMKDNEDTIIEKGTPLCQLIPFNLSPTNTVVREATDKEQKWEKQYTFFLGSKFKTKKGTKVGELYERFFGERK